MSIIYWLLGALVLGLLIVMVIGIYELIVENRYDQKVADRTSAALHLRRLDRINNGK